MQREVSCQILPVFALPDQAVSLSQHLETLNGPAALCCNPFAQMALVLQLV